MTEHFQQNIDGSLEAVVQNNGLPSNDNGVSEWIDLPKGLADLLTEAKESNERAGIPFFEDYANEGLDSWELFCDSDYFPEQLLSILKEFLLLPRADFQIPIAASYLMLCSPMCHQLPILFSHGLSGSGKSTLGHIACKLHNRRPISAGSTPVAIRNDIQNGRWYEPKAGRSEKGNERPYALVWEDINANELLRQDGMILSILKNGIDRSGTVSIGALGGVNVEFEVFAPKYLSSVHPLYSDYQFRELVRRCIVIEHKPYSLWNENDYSNFYHLRDAEDINKIEFVNWDGLQHAFMNFWRDIERLKEYASLKRSLARIKKHGIQDVYYRPSLDLIATGVICGFWQTKEQGIDHMREYWMWHENNVTDEKSATEKSLLKFINSKTEKVQTQNDQFRQLGMYGCIREVEISPKELRDYILDANIKGELDSGISNKEIVRAMNGLGWKLGLNHAEQMMWCKIKS